MNNPFSLSGKTVLVTGATAGLGRQTAIHATQMGATVVITGRNEERLNSTMLDLEGTGHIAIPCDLTVEGSRNSLVEKIPPIDGLVHCAGLTLLHPFKFIDELRFHTIYAINVEAPLFLTQRLYKSRRLKPGGSIVFISSMAPKVGTKGHSIYAGSKSALYGITRVLAHELAAARIRVNSLSPAMVKTEVTEGFERQISSELMAIDEARYPLGYGDPEDVANAVIFFLSQASKWITGTDLVMDGGLT
jgi:NAD(P)-dependent dehydrogenase (short-subunit alcohol dehydrogenase family)